MASGFHLVFFLWMTSGLLMAGTSSAALPDDSKAPCCPPFWTQLGSRCFIFNYKPAPFYKAESICQALGGNLVSIHNEKENLFVRELIKKGAGAHSYAWIGAHDGVQEGRWMWTDGTLFDYFTWLPGRPDNARGNEDCVHNSVEEPIPFWNDWGCHHSLPFVCTKNL